MLSLATIVHLSDALNKMPKQLKIEAIVPAAGLGLRLKSKIPKPLVLVNDCAIIIRTLLVISSHPAISKIIVLTHRKNLSEIKKIIEKNKIRKVKCIVKGGLTRRQSVGNGLRFLDEDTDFVLIHDGARPFVTRKIISRVVLGAQKYGAAVTGIPLTPTIKMVSAAGGSASGGKGQGLRGKERFVSETLDRRNIWEIQTPQVFKKDLILEAYRRIKDKTATDDAYLVEKLGRKVSVVEGSYFNIKITTPEDLVFAEAIAKRVKG